MSAVVVIATVPALWVLFWLVVFILSDPLTWLLYAAGELAEERLGVKAALALLGALAGFLAGLALFSVSYEAWIVAAPLATVGCVACVWVMAKSEGKP